VVIDKFDDKKENNHEVRSDFYVMLREYLDEGDYRTAYQIPQDKVGKESTLTP
jgi:hypothetical protein